MNDDVDFEKWLSVADPTPRLGWYKNVHTGRIHFSKSPRQPKRKFGSTQARPQRTDWQAEDNIAYFTWKYGWTCCYYCRDCSCCCKCHGPPEWSISMTESDEEDADVVKVVAAN